MRTDDHHEQTLWHPMQLPDTTPSTKEERICAECGKAYVAYCYHRDARCEHCRRERK